MLYERWENSSNIFLFPHVFYSTGNGKEYFFGNWILIEDYINVFLLAHITWSRKTLGDSLSELLFAKSSCYCTSVSPWKQVVLKNCRYYSFCSKIHKHSMISKFDTNLLSGALMWQIKSIYAPFLVYFQWNVQYWAWSRGDNEKFQIGLPQPKKSY